MKKIEIFFLALIFMAGLCGYFIGANSTTKLDSYPEALTQQQVLDYLQHMQYTHRQVVENPEWLDSLDKSSRQLLGDVEFHQSLVIKYQQIIDYIELR